MPKHDLITQTLAQRIHQGDYHVRPIPSLQKLAVELAADRHTVSKAMRNLLADGLVVRSPSGRISVPSAGGRSGLHVALLAPAYPTVEAAVWIRVLERLVESRGWKLRAVGYTHEHDPIILGTLSGFDGVFLAPFTECFTPEVVKKLQNPTCKAVVLTIDMSAQGVPSLSFEDPLGVSKVLDHLHQLGHRTIACLNTQPVGAIIQERIDQWAQWSAGHGVTGPLINEPVQSFNDPIEQAYRVTRQRLRAGAPGAGALFCITGAAAMGAMRALADCGLQVGRAVSVCAADNHGRQHRFLNPTLTCCVPGPMEPYFEVCLDWFARPDRRWLGPMLVRAPGGPLYVGQSTGPAEPPPPPEG
jgi:DNA-binding LacI/PurR family transcriptional regulator